MRTVDILRTICGAPGVSGTERATAGAIETILREYTDDVRTDALGNLIGTVNPGKEKSVVLTAHMDKIGLAVTAIDEKSGFLRLTRCGGTDLRVMAAARVKVYGKRTLDGVIISTPPHLADKADRKKAAPIDRSAVDCGLPYEEIKEIVSVGDRIELRLPFTELLNGRATSPFLDNSAGCTAVLKALEKLAGKDFPYTVHAVFATREEVGKQGAQTALFGLEPDEALVTDVSFAAGYGVSEEQGAKLGSGAMIACSPILQKEVSDTLKALAEKNGIPHTIEVLGRHTGTDADVATITGAGVKTGLISIPLKNMHTSAELAQLSDIEAVADLMAAYVTREG
ncbi:MAG: M20/M25/M40 family metallo-hydrolase [Clostridia bacterium]|nr:M20/M25/M40 family metallo-hydrolase [Clostridia bacterium]